MSAVIASDAPAGLQIPPVEHADDLHVVQPDGVAPEAGVRWLEYPTAWHRHFAARFGRAFTAANAIGQCHIVAHQFRDFLCDIANSPWAHEADDVTAPFGLYTGPSNAACWAADRGRTRHGWLVVATAGSPLAGVLDPTRFGFYEALQDRALLAVVTGPAAMQYDLGGLRFQASVIGVQPMPPFEPARVVACDDADVLAFFDGAVSVRQLAWMASLPPDSPRFRDDAHRRRLIGWLQASPGLDALVPVDLRV